MESTLILKLESCGNPDFGQNPNKPIPGAKLKFVEVGSYKKASEVCRSWIGEHNLGGGNWCGGQLTRHGVEVGHVSYNGRVWDINDKEINIDEAEQKSAPDADYPRP